MRACRLPSIHTNNLNPSCFAPWPVGINALLHRLEVLQQVLGLEGGFAKANMHIAGLVSTILHLAALKVLDSLQTSQEAGYNAHHGKAQTG